MSISLSHIAFVNAFPVYTVLSERFNKPQPEQCMGQGMGRSLALISFKPNHWQASRTAPCSMLLRFLPEARYFIIGLCMLAKTASFLTDSCGIDPLVDPTDI